MVAEALDAVVVAMAFLAGLLLSHFAWPDLFPGAASRWVAALTGRA